MSRERKLPTKGQTEKAEVDAFLRRVAATPAPVRQGETGRLIFAMDATASREPTWDNACQIQGEMFDATASLGGLSVQLVYYRGFGECRASKWVRDSRALVRAMTAVHCLGGHTQIRRVLQHALDETQVQRVHALVFVGDAMEENVDELCAIAGELGLRGVPAFMFHEGAGSGSRTGLSPDCAAHQRRLPALRRVERAPAQGTSRRGRGLCRRRAQGAHGLRPPARRGGAADRPSDQMSLAGTRTRLPIR